MLLSRIDTLSSFYIQILRNGARFGMPVVRKVSDLYELSVARKIYFRSYEGRNAMRGYVPRNDASKKFTFDVGEQWPLAIGSGKFSHAVHAPAVARLFSAVRDLHERRKCIAEMDNDVEVIHPRSAEAIKQHSTPRYKLETRGFRHARISLGQPQATLTCR